MVIDQLTRTLAAEKNNEHDVSVQISGPSGGDAASLSELGITAAVHDKELLNLGYLDGARCTAHRVCFHHQPAASFPFAGGLTPIVN
jgi:hypothetical protein